jgi:REP element-mobilizing transposase RayT
VPGAVKARIQSEIELLSNQKKLTQKNIDSLCTKKLELALDQGYGSCILRDPRIAGMVENSLLFFDGSRYRLLAWVIMPNHVHALIEIFDSFPLYKILKSWKSFTSHEINKILNKSGRNWQREYYDRFIRNETHFYNCVAYIHNNPVKAGLVDVPEAWDYSSSGLFVSG